VCSFIPLFLRLSPSFNLEYFLNIISVNY
jgi:hypothetical protein